MRAIPAEMTTAACNIDSIFDTFRFDSKMDDDLINSFFLFYIPLPLSLSGQQSQPGKNKQRNKETKTKKHPARFKLTTAAIEKREMEMRRKQRPK